MYMMTYLEPSVEVTGGPWYTDSEFDSAFMSILLDQFYNYNAARVY
jgi:DNA-directed RNA polymerase III subunit RPC6